MKNNYIKTIIGMMILTLVVSNVSALAISMNSGESKVIDFSNEFYSLNGSYSIIGNSLNLNGMNITFDGTKVNITLDLGYAPDTFDLTVYGLTKQEVISYSSSSSSAGCLINWSCSNWSQCSNNATTRTCIKVAPLYCYGGKKPIENKTCIVTSIDNIACTADAKICPDGSSVGRISPNCKFASCPDIVEKEGLSLFWKIVIGFIIFGILCIFGYAIYIYIKEQNQTQDNF